VEGGWKGFVKRQNERIETMGVGMIDIRKTPRERKHM
jgi:hypothetical protein